MPLTKDEAHKMARDEGIDFTNPDHAVLSYSQLVFLSELSRKTRYKHPADSPCSTGAGFFTWLYQHRMAFFAVYQNRPTREILTWADTRREASQHVKEYRQNQPETAPSLRRYVLTWAKFVAFQ